MVLKMVERTDGNKSLKKKHPPPPRKTPFPIQMIQPKIQDSTQSKNSYLTRLQKRKAKLLFFASIPGAD